MAESIAVFLLEKLSDLLLHEASKIREAEEQLRLLQTELEWMRLFLRDADAQRRYNDRLKLTVKQMRDATFDAEDVVDEFLYKLHRPPSVEQQSPNDHLGIFACFARCLCLANKPLILLDLADRIRAINAMIGKISSNKSRYDVPILPISGVDSISSAVVVPPRAKRLPIAEEDDVVGVGDGVETVKELLLSKECRRVVVSIVGMGGLGKTTLAKRVYKSVEFMGYFDCHAWVDVSQEYDFRDLLTRIGKGVMAFSNTKRDELKEMSDGDLSFKLNNYLKDKKYLIVLDDIWDAVAWNGLSHYFPNSKNGGRILITSRNKDIALYADPRRAPYELRCLDKVESWDLFIMKVFGGRVDCPPELEGIGREIVGKCGGLPLGIVVLGGLLSTKEKTRQSWQAVLDSLTWHLDQGSDSCMGILGLSYNDLPYYLKSCFLYLGMYPEDREIKARRLMRLWIAEGFVQKRGEGVILEDVAEDYLHELVNRNMIRVDQRKPNGRVKSCRIHDLLRDLAISEAKEAKFFEFFGSKNLKSPRRIVMIIEEDINIVCEDTYIAHQVCIHSGLRSFNYVGKSLYEVRFLWPKGFGLLRVLDLHNLLKLNLPKTLGDLFHLRYLGLRHASFGTLPKSIEKLTNLEVLDLKYTYIKDLPGLVWKLKNLYYLNLGFQPCHIPELLQNDCFASLLTLRGLRVDESSPIKGGLSRFSELRELDMFCCIRSWEELSCWIAQLVPLQLLQIRTWDKMRLKPLLNLKHLSVLRLTGYLENTVEALELPQSLVVLTLNDSCLQEDPMSTLGQLLNLRVLELLNRSCNATKMTCLSGGFPELKYLWLDSQDLEEWDVMEGAMPRLQTLKISPCKTLRELPSRFAPDGYLLGSEFEWNARDV